MEMGLAFLAICIDNVGSIEIDIYCFMNNLLRALEVENMCLALSASGEQYPDFSCNYHVE